MPIPGMVCTMEKSREQVIVERRLADISYMVSVIMELEGRAQQRASTFAGYFLAGATALGLNAITLNPESFDIAVASYSAAATFYLGALLCAMAAWPGVMLIAGADPSLWVWIKEWGGNPDEISDHLIENIEEKYAENMREAARTRRWFRAGAWTGLAAPVIGLIGWWLA